MKNVDVLFIYETKVRELESICLLKSEMERRGYTTAVLNTWNEIGNKKHKYNAKVVVSPSMYNDGIFDFVKSLSGNVKKLVNLQWEQIGPVGDDERDDAWFILKGMAHQCMNVCWGDETYNRLTTRAGIDDKHLCKTGHIAMDFCKPEYRNYYMPKNELFNMYNIPCDKEVNLFISSFSYVNLSKQQMDNSLYSEVDNYVDFSVKSFIGVIEWFDRFLEEFPEQVLVYRPHPAEAGHEKLNELSKKYPNRFFVIVEHSVKQWLAVADRVYTWYSTSTAEAYAFGKPVAVLRPVEIPNGLETSLLKDAKKIGNYEDFTATIKSEFEQSLSAESFNQFYLYDETPAYLRISDAIERVMKDDSYLIIDSRPIKKTSFKLKMKKIAHGALSVVAKLLPKKSKILKKYRVEAKVDEYTLKLQARNYASEEEISKMQDGIIKVFFN